MMIIKVGHLTTSGEIWVGDESTCTRAMVRMAPGTLAPIYPATDHEAMTCSSDHVDKSSYIIKALGPCLARG